ncbi:MAG: hypothetical protein ACJ8GN_24325 [Longimicrobiaceae bacterium]
MQIVLPPTDLAELVFWSAALATFIGSVMAQEQSEKLRNGTFGAVAGVSVGSFAALMNRGEARFVLVGLFGSAVGALAGWVFYLGLTVLATRPSGRRMVEYLYGGVPAVRASLQLSDREHLSEGLAEWCQNFRRVIDLEIAAMSPGSPANRIESEVRSWLHAVIDVVNLVYLALAAKREFGARITLIRFERGSGEVLGHHWVSYSGKQAHHKPKEFTSESLAYQVLSGNLESPHFVDVKDLTRGQVRSESRTVEYQTFVLSRVTDDVVLSFDWPGEFGRNEPHVEVITQFLHLDLCPSIGRLLKMSAAPPPPPPPPAGGGTSPATPTVQLPAGTPLIP